VHSKGEEDQASVPGEGEDYSLARPGLMDKKKRRKRDGRRSPLTEWSKMVGGLARTENWLGGTRNLFSSEGKEKRVSGTETISN